MRVVEFAEANTQAAAARKFGVAENHEAVQVEPGGSRSGCLELEENCLAKIYRETSFQFFINFSSLLVGKRPGTFHPLPFN